MSPFQGYFDQGLSFSTILPPLRGFLRSSIFFLYGPPWEKKSLRDDILLICRLRNSVENKPEGMIFF